MLAAGYPAPAISWVVLFGAVGVAALVVGGRWLLT